MRASVWVLQKLTACSWPAVNFRPVSARPNPIHISKFSSTSTVLSSSLAASGALEGIKILDLTRALAVGPWRIIWLTDCLEASRKESYIHIGPLLHPDISRLWSRCH